MITKKDLMNLASKMKTLSPVEKEQWLGNLEHCRAFAIQMSKNHSTIQDTENYENEKKLIIRGLSRTLISGVAKEVQAFISASDEEKKEFYQTVLGRSTYQKMIPQKILKLLETHKHSGFVNH